MRFRFALLTALVLAPLASVAQTVDVTFRFLPDLTPPEISPVVRAFVPGSFNDWGPNSNGQIGAGAPSDATYDADLNEYRYTQALDIGQSYAYKVHYHKNASGSDWEWLTDPLGTETTGPNNDSVVRPADPMVFQIAREQNSSGEVTHVSAGIFGTEAISTVTFTINETVITTGIEDTGDGIYRLELATSVPPGSFVKVEATDAQSRTVSAEVGTIPPDVTDALVPDGLADGITYGEDGTSATLVLRAPGKQYVYALGDFNNWVADANSLMFRDDTDPLGTRWWIELTGLTSGTEVAFQYWVDGTIRVADPYTSKVYYPGESAYPSGAMEHAVGVLTPGAPAFDWQVDDFEAPPLAELVVYELLVRDFVRDRSFTALTDTLDYLERLGVNAIELMPVSEFDGDESWGYNPAFHLALDKAYGTPDAFKAFVDAAHERGMAVLLDVVYNHATGQSPLIRLDNQGDFGSPNPSNPWANPSARHPFNVFNDLNHESELTKIWLDQANRFWMDEYRVDGYRFDLSKGFTQTCGGGTCTDGNFSTYNPARIAILKRMADSLWAAHPEAIIILEHFADDREQRELATYGQDRGHPGMSFWNNLNHAYNESSMGYIDGDASLTRSYAPSASYPLHGLITFMESHDEQWLMYKNRRFGNANGGYDIRQLENALDRQKLVGTFFLLTPGPRMLWQFGEAGYGGGPGECLKPGSGNGDCSPSDPSRVGNKPIRWDYLYDVPAVSNGSGASVSTVDAAEREERRLLYRTWSALLGLRNTATVFRQPDTFESRVGGVPDRWMKLSLPDAPDGEPTEAIVYGNFGMTSQTVTLEFSETKTWYGFFDDRETTLAAGTHSFTLQPGEFHVWTDVDVPSPDGLIAISDEPGPEGESGLRGVYPNPSVASSTVRYELATPGSVRLEVFDALGRRVATLTDARQPVGVHELMVDTSSWPSGVYVVRMTTEDGMQTVRLTVAR
ncbi:MAG: alpha-amylase family glycosyl hydrolase [Bacteroidota bacterium]